MESKQDTYYEELITRYLSGDATEEEIGQISRWVESDAGNRKVFTDLHAAWLLLQKERVAGINVNSEFQHVAPASHSHVPWFSTGAFLRIAAILLLLLIPSFFLLNYFSSGKLQHLVAGSDQLEQQLPDGSQVTLNVSSTLEYPKRFRGNTRTVSLDGDAWFEVSRDTKKPFVIAAGKVRVEVLGTSFYVNTRESEDKMEVTLSSGSVALSFEDQPSKKILVRPGETASIGISEEEITVSPTNDPNFLAWKTKKIVFTNESLDNVVKTLKKVYLTEIILTEPGLERCLLTATFDNKPLGSVLKVIEAALGVKAVDKGNSVFISGPACE